MSPASDAKPGSVLLVRSGDKENFPNLTRNLRIDS